MLLPYCPNFCLTIYFHTLQKFKDVESREDVANYTNFAEIIAVKEEVTICNQFAIISATF